MEKSEKKEKHVDLDDVLINELGQFGWFQLRNILLAAVPLMMSAFMSEYVFSAAAIPHRCRITECGENGKLQEFKPDWITNAIPETNSGLASCQRYAPTGVGNGTLDYCPLDMFDHSSTIGCDGFVYGKENSVVYDFDLGCQDWLRALAGTFSSIGVLFSLPITGVISDRYGRKFALVINVFNMGFIGIIRAFSVNYTMYLIMQLLQTMLAGGIVSSAYILTTEFVGPKYRVLTSATITSMFSVGEVILGLVAWKVQAWRTMIIALNIPCFLVISYYWILPESVRWLLAKKKYAKAIKMLENIARKNKAEISEESMRALTNPAQQIDNSIQVEKPSVIKAIIRSPILLRRVCTTPIWWITTIFIYYGLSINSTSLSDTIYLNFILICAIEVPGFYFALLVLDRIGRRATLSVGFFINAVCNIAFIFVPNDMWVTRLIIYLVGKFVISTVVTSLYLYTSELYPTEYRHSLFAFSSMVGRIGSITAPLTPVLTNYWHGIPSLLFGGLAVLSGLLVLTQPDTRDTKMPDTLAEAEALGRPESKIPKMKEIQKLAS